MLQFERGDIMASTKSDIKAKLTKMYQLRKELYMNIENSKAALKDVDNIINVLTDTLKKMEEEVKK